MRPWHTSWRRHATSSALLAVAAALASAGCVTRGTYQEAVAERDALRERVRLLTASNESLSNERVKLISDVEDLGSEREKLTRSVEELRSAHDQLQQNLASTSSQLAARDAEVKQLRSTY